MATMEKVPMLAEGYERLTADLKHLRSERPKKHSVDPRHCELLFSGNNKPDSTHACLRDR